MFGRKASKEKLHYLCTAQMVQDDYGRRRKAYRFNVIDLSDAKPRLAFICDDICSSDEEAHELESYFRRNEVALCHVQDVLEEWVAEH